MKDRFCFREFYQPIASECLGSSVVLGTGNCYHMNQTYVLTPYGATIWFAVQAEIIKLNAEVASLKQVIKKLEANQNGATR